MAVWAYACRPCAGKGVWFVSRASIMEMPADVHMLRVKVGSEWRCATVDRNRQVEVEAMLLRDAVASDLVDCPECAPHAVPEAAQSPDKAGGREIQAAAISIDGRPMLVVLVPLDLVRSSGEADMLIADLRPRFGNVAVLLMGQDDDGTPHYHGNPALVELLADVPVDQMPWKHYPLG